MNTPTLKGDMQTISVTMHKTMLSGLPAWELSANGTRRRRITTRVQ
jgi:hypothetical protein